MPLQRKIEEHRHEGAREEDQRKRNQKQGKEKMSMMRSQIEDQIACFRRRRRRLLDHHQASNSALFDHLAAYLRIFHWKMQSSPKRTSGNNRRTRRRRVCREKKKEFTREGARGWSQQIFLSLPRGCEEKRTARGRWGEKKPLLGEYRNTHFHPKIKI